MLTSMSGGWVHPCISAPVVPKHKYVKQKLEHCSAWAGLTPEEAGTHGSPALAKFEMQPPGRKQGTSTGSAGANVHAECRWVCPLCERARWPACMAAALNNPPAVSLGVQAIGFEHPCAHSSTHVCTYVCAYACVIPAVCVCTYGHTPVKLGLSSGCRGLGCKLGGPGSR